MVSNLSRQLKMILTTLNYTLASVLFLSFFFIQYNFVSPGTIAGRLAIYTLWLIAVPGILSRFKVSGFLRKCQIVLMSIRRQLGLLMFALVCIHYFWSRGFSFISNGFPQTLPLFQSLGFIAFWLLVPLAITSNNWSVKKMKGWWQRLHYLTYPVMFLLAFHTALFPVNSYIFGVGVNMGNIIQYSIPTLLIICIQMASWIDFYKRK